MCVSVSCSLIQTMLTEYSYFIYAICSMSCDQFHLHTYMYEFSIKINFSHFFLVLLQLKAGLKVFLHSKKPIAVAFVVIVY